MQPAVLALLLALISCHEAVAQGFGRRLGLSEFATNDLLRHARASTSSEETAYPSIESRQMPYQEQPRSRQRALRPVQRRPLSKGSPMSNRNNINRFGSPEEESSNLVQQGWGQEGRTNKRVGIPDNVDPFIQRRQGNHPNWYTSRFGPHNGFKWPADFGSFNINTKGPSTNRRFGLDDTLGYFSSALRLLSYLVRIFNESSRLRWRQSH